MNLISVPTSDLKDELDRRNGIFYRGGFRHKPGCNSGIVNPVTEWAGGSNVIITGYKCPMCGEITKTVGFS